MRKKWEGGECWWMIFISGCFQMKVLSESPMNISKWRVNLNVSACCKWMMSKNGINVCKWEVYWNDWCIHSMILNRVQEGNEMNISKWELILLMCTRGGFEMWSENGMNVTECIHMIGLNEKWARTEWKKIQIIGVH